MNGKAAFPLEARSGTFNKMSRCFLWRFHLTHFIEQLCHKNWKKKKQWMDKFTTPMAVKVKCFSYKLDNQKLLLFLFVESIFVCLSLTLLFNYCTDSWASEISEDGCNTILHTLLFLLVLLAVLHLIAFHPLPSGHMYIIDGERLLKHF